MEFKSYIFLFFCRYVNLKIENGMVYLVFIVVEEVRFVICVYELSEVNCSLMFLIWFEVECLLDR